MNTHSPESTPADPADEILDIVLECVFAGMVGVIDNLAGLVTLDGFLAPRAWR
jgi:hypothetical protein